MVKPWKQIKEEKGKGGVIFVKTAPMPDYEAVALGRLIAEEIVSPEPKEETPGASQVMTASYKPSGTLYFDTEMPDGKRLRIVSRHRESHEVLVLLDGDTVVTLHGLGAVAVRALMESSFNAEAALAQPRTKQGE